MLLGQVADRLAGALDMPAARLGQGEFEREVVQAIDTAAEQRAGEDLDEPHLPGTFPVGIGGAGHADRLSLMADVVWRTGLACHSPFVSRLRLGGVVCSLRRR